MTKLEHVEIEGFKALEHVEFEPTDINLITGRNNTGKTSFLEAVDLSFSPEKIRNFEEKANAVVRRGFPEAKIKTGTNWETTELVIRSASAGEKERYLREAIVEHLQNSILTGRKQIPEENDTNLVSYSTSSVEDTEDLNDWVQEIIYKASSWAVNGGIGDSPTTICLELEIDGGNYPYIYFHKNNPNLMDTITDALGAVLLEDIGEEQFTRHPDGYVVNDPKTEGQIVEFQTNFSRVLRGGLFIKDPPESNDASFVSSGSGPEKIETTDSENAAIRIDDIGDFIKEKGIVDNLKTFGLDTLIFKTEDGEKESIPYEFMGDGFKSMVNLLWELMDDEVENSVVLIEEPENHMHPGYVLELVHFLIDLAKDENVQFFITTHDHDFIKDFFADMPDEKRDYLEDEFSLVRMDDFGAEVLDYETAEHELKDLHLDLRGI